MIMFFIGMVLLGINIATLGSGAATALGAINAATAIFTEFLGDAMQRAVFISDMQSQFSRILKSQREALFAYLKEEEEKKKKKKNRNDKGYSCADGGECDLACEITLNEPLKYKQIVAILKRTAFGEILSELYGIWLDEKYGKDGDEAEKDKKVGNLLEKAYKKIAKIKKERYLDKGEKKLFTMSELVDISLDEAWSGQQYLGMSKKYNSIDDPAEKKEYQNMWNWMLDTFQKKAVTTVLCQSEHLQLIAMAHILKITCGKTDEEKLADEIAERVWVVFEKLLNMNPGGFTLREVEAGKSFVANYMVNNRCPECGYIGDGVFRDGANRHRLLCAACGSDVSFEQYAAPEVYRKYAEMVDTKLNEFKAAYEEHCNKHKEELQLSFDEFKDQIISAFTKLEISQKIRLDEHGESIARLDESVGELSEEVKKLLDKLTEELKQHENDVQAFTEAINQSRKWQVKADNYFKEIFNKLSAGEERLDKIDESIKELINNQRIDIAALNKDLNKDFNALSKKIDEASQQNTEEHNVIIQKLTEINTMLKELTDEKPSGEANEVQKQLEGINTTLKELTKGKPRGEANEVQKQLEEIKTTLSEFAERFEKGEAEKKRPSDKEDDVDKQLTEIKATLQTLIKTLVPSPRPSDEFSTGSTNLKPGGDEQPVARPLPQGENTPYVPTGTSSAGGVSQKPSQPIAGTPPAPVYPVPTPESRCAYCGAKGRFKAYFDSQRIERSKCKVCGNEFEVDISAGESWRKLYIPYPNGNINNKSLNDGIVYVERAPQHTWRVNGIESVKLIICGPDIGGNLNITQECLNLILNPITIVYMATGCVGEII